ncbi:VWA-like domain-containing protein [Streptomyces sp. NPDC001816]|uniref:vWA domain-containing protein n=1 Tax=Streptomyces sp. NPDC001816 TaxID=3364612 RepID=UPI00368412D9
MSGLHLDALPPELRQKWAAARVWAAHRVPYLARALMTLDPVVVPDTEDTDDGAALRRFPADVGWHIHISPAEIGRQSVPQIGFWLLHQLTHVLRGHAAQFPTAGARPELVEGAETGLFPLTGRTPEQQVWNVATDAEINDDLLMAGLELPADAAMPGALGLPDNGLAERYWSLLRERTEPIEARLSAGDCGTGCDGRPRPWNCDWPGVSRTTAQLTALDTARRIRDHQRTREDVPGGWRRWADEVLEPTVNWRRQLAAQIRRGIADTAGRVDYTYRKPSRRAGSLPDVVLPGLHQALPVVAVVIDTSGSMSDSMLGQSLAEVSGVLRAVGIGRDRITVMSVDARVYRAQSLHRISDLRLGGGGGSDIRVGIAAAAALKPAPDLIVVLTDGHTPWPDAPPPRTRVVVGLLDPAGLPPDWATTVLISDQSRK